ncbi:hypothetical protein D3C71_1432220 [compost metagenome]
MRRAFACERVAQAAWWLLPFAIGVIENAWGLGSVSIGARHRTAQAYRFGEQRSGLLIRIERLAFLDANGLHLRTFQWPENVQGLFVHEHCQQFVEVEIVGEQRVDVLPGAVHELHGGR